MIKYVIIFLFLSSCSTYEVIQSVGDNQYHMYRKGSVQIVDTDEKLVIGEKYNIKKIQKK